MLEALQKVKDVETHLIVSTGAKATIAYETSWKIDDVLGLADLVHDERDLAATLASGSFQTAGETVTVTGVGFFDLLHGQSGAAPNGIELHAVLDICFGTDCASIKAAAAPP